MNYAMRRTSTQGLRRPYTNRRSWLDPAFKERDRFQRPVSRLRREQEVVRPLLWKYHVDGEATRSRDSAERPPYRFQHLQATHSVHAGDGRARCAASRRRSSRRWRSSTAGPRAREDAPSPTRLNLTQHTNGGREHPRALHAAAPAGNIGRPGGGVTACVATPTCRARRLELLYHELPATCRCRCATRIPISRRTSRRDAEGRFWVNRPEVMVSLLKAFYDDPATKDTDSDTSGSEAASADAYSTAHVRGYVQRHHQGFLADGRTRRWAAQRQAGAGRHAAARLGSSSSTSPDGDGRGWKEPGVNPRTSRTEVSSSGRAGRGEGRQPPTTMRLISGTRRRSIRRATCRPTRSFSARWPTGCRDVRRQHEGARQGSAPPTSPTREARSSRMVEVLKERSTASPRWTSATRTASPVQEGPSRFIGSRSSRTTARRRPAAGSTRVYRPKARTASSSTGGLAQAARARLPGARLASAWPAKPPHHLQPRLRRPHRQALEPKGRADLVDPARRGQRRNKPGKWSGLDVPDFKRVPRARREER